MFSINEYQSLKINGTWRDRLQYVLSIPNKDSIENYLKESLFSSYDDLKMLIFLSVSSKNDKNLMEIFKNDSLPIHQRISAGQYWIKFQKDEKQIHNLLVEVINDKNIARYLKHQILKVLPRIKLLKKSNSFFYDLICDLTKYNNHDQYNIDGHLVPCCKKEQIINLLSQWSLKRFEQIDCLSSFYFKLIRYQPLIVLRLIKEDLDALKTNDEKFSDYFQKNEKLFNLLAKKIPKELINLTIEYLNQLEKHKRFLPQFIQSQEKYFFKKVPDRMIQLITIVAINKPGKIKYMTRWSQEGYELNSLSLPTSFSIENYINLFFSLYDTYLYPKLIHKSMLDELNDSLSSFTIKIWRLPQIDSFLNLFFTEHLCSSTKIQSSFDIDQHSSLISFFLKNKSTQLERINQLINNINKIFFVNTNVQRIALRSQQYRQFIDELIQDEKCSALTTNNTNETTSGRTRGAAVQPIDTIVLCLPARFDITSENLYKHLDLLKNNLNTSNAKFISDAILNISRKINDDIFLKFYIEFISDEKFPKLGKLNNNNK
ncbi:unnamed protein product [Rotaria socialis]